MTEHAFNTVRSGLSKRANEALEIPPRYRKLSLENFHGAGDEIALARRSLERSTGVFLSGPCGVGKTHLAVALLLDWYANALRDASAGGVALPKGLFVSSSDLALELADLGKRREPQFLRRYDDVDCLLLDDVGAELSSERSRAVFGALIDRRYRRIRRTLITTNLSLQELGEFYDDRTASRIVGMCALVRLSGADRRIVSEVADVVADDRGILQP